MRCFLKRPKVCWLTEAVKSGKYYSKRAARVTKKKKKKNRMDRKPVPLIRITIDVRSSTARSLSASTTPSTWKPNQHVLFHFSGRLHVFVKMERERSAAVHHRRHLLDHQLYSSSQRFHQTVCCCCCCCCFEERTSFFLIPTNPPSQAPSHTHTHTKDD